MDDDVCHGKRVIGIEINNADVPADRRRSDNDILADIQKTICEILVERLSEVRGERNYIDWKKNGLDDHRQRDKIVLHKPLKVPRQRSHPKRQRIDRRKIDCNRIDPPSRSRCLSQLPTVQRNPAILLAHKVKHRDNSKHLPKHQLALGIQSDTDRVPE